MRASTLPMVCSLLAFAVACADKPGEDTPARGSSQASASRARASEAEPAPGPDDAAASHGQPAVGGDEPAPREAEAEIEAEGVSSASETGATAELEGEPEPTSEPPEPGDPLAPILPSGPEPGSPEADAELAELLEESTLTQEEFDAAFRSNKPRIEGEQFVFGPNDHTRKRPVVSVGTPSVAKAKIDASELARLAKAHMRGFEGCLAAALIDAPQTKGSVTLVVDFDGKGEASNTKIEGGAELGEPLRECLATVADGWSLAGAAGATARIPITLGS